MALHFVKSSSPSYPSSISLGEPYSPLCSFILRLNLGRSLRASPLCETWHYSCFAIAPVGSSYRSQASSRGGESSSPDRSAGMTCNQLAARHAHLVFPTSQVSDDRSFNQHCKPTPYYCSGKHAPSLNRIN